MKQKIKLTLFYSSTLPLLLATRVSAAAVSATPAKLSQLDSVFENVLKASLTLVGAVSVVMLVVGGFKYLMAGGNKEAASGAQHTLTFAIGGLILSVSAWLILLLVGEFLGINVNTFTICIIPGCT